MLFRKIELEPGFICEYGYIDPSEAMILEDTPRADYIDFGFCLRGQMRVNIDGIDNTFITQKDRGNIIHGGNNKAVHELYPGKGFQWINIRLSPYYLEQSTGCNKDCILANMQKIHCKQSDPMYYHDFKLTFPMKECAFHILESDTANPAKRLFLRAKCLELVSWQLAGLGPITDDFPERCSLDLKIRNARNILINNFRNPPAIKKIARMVGLNDTYLKQAFKKKYHTSIYQYLLSFRLEYAKNLIVHHKLTVSEAGYAVGYSSISQFSSTFKKYHGAAPGYFKTAIEN